MVRAFSDVHHAAAVRPLYSNLLTLERISVYIYIHICVSSLVKFIGGCYWREVARGGGG